jgi:hypothetical protein
MKICNNPKCTYNNILQPLLNFNKNKNTKDGYSNRCKNCVKQSVRKSYENNKSYYIADSIKRQKEYRIQNPEGYKEYRNKWNNILKEERYWEQYYQQNKAKLKEYSKLKKVKDKRNERWKQRYYSDTSFRVKEIMKSNFHLFFKDKGLNKNLSFTKIINYSYKDLIVHLETNFRTGMTWENFGNLWEIHHIKPQNMFNPLNEQEVKECWDLNNLLPLWKTTEISEQMGDNLKGNRNLEKTKIYDFRTNG